MKRIVAGLLIALTLSTIPIKAQSSGGGGGGGWTDPTIAFGSSSVTIYWMTFNDLGWLEINYLYFVYLMGAPIICWEPDYPDCGLVH
jgi:hypothetical protein